MLFYLLSQTKFHKLRKLLEEKHKSQEDLNFVNDLLGSIHEDAQFDFNSQADDQEEWYLGSSYGQDEVN